MEWPQDQPLEQVWSFLLSRHLAWIQSWSAVVTTHNPLQLSLPPTASIWTYTVTSDSSFMLSCDCRTQTIGSVFICCFNESSTTRKQRKFPKNIRNLTERCMCTDVLCRPAHTKRRPSILSPWCLGPLEQLPATVAYSARYITNTPWPVKWHQTNINPKPLQLATS